MIQRNLLIFLGFLTLCSMIRTTGCTDDDSLVEISQGKLVGIKESSLKGKEYYSYLGIPFAKPPVGDLRFKDPEAAGSWEGVLNAGNYPPVCLQYNMLAMVTPGELKPVGIEDCLYLNVNTPKADGRGRPVMVFIHGGGYMSGSTVEYQSRVLMEEDIVFVTIQYRLSIFGFLSTDDDTMPGNFGMKDQTLALKWVQKNIAKFGGDPDNVTIFGESAGAGSVHLHVLSPWSKGLFKQAIAQSGASNCHWSQSKHHREHAEVFGEAVGCPLDKCSQEYLDCLRGKDSIDLLTSSLVLYDLGVMPLTMVPRIDGDYLPDNPVTLMKENRYNNVKFMIGMVRDEGAFLTYMMSVDPRYDVAMEKQFLKYGAITLGVHYEEEADQITADVFNYYYKGKECGKESRHEFTEMLTDSMFSICFDITSLYHAANTDMDVYRYELHHRGKTSFGDFFNMPESKDWISHVDDLFYLFTSPPIFHNPMEDPEDQKVRDIFSKLWTNFAKTGNPTPDDSLGFKWTAATLDDFKHLSITPNPQMAAATRQKKHEFWSSLPLSENKLHSDLVKRLSTPASSSSENDEL